MGGSIKVLIRTQGERVKVLQDDEGPSTRRGEPELIVFPSSRLIAEKDLTWMCGENTGGMRQDDVRSSLKAVGLIPCALWQLVGPSY